MPGARFFPDARLNFAENLLRRRDDRPALIFNGENRAASLDDRWRAAARGGPVRRGACGGTAFGPAIGWPAFMPNLPETIVAALGCAAIGAVWSSCSPDFGVQGVLDRFGQIEPRLLIAADGYFYAGKTHDSLARIAQVASGRCRPSSARSSFPTSGAAPDSGGLPNAVTWHDYLADGSRRAAVRSAAVRSPALHPVFLGHHRRAQVHRARRRRHADPAPEGASAPLRHQAGRSRLLLHDLRLDDVELAGLGARIRRDAAALRRLAVPSGRQRPVRLRRRRPA